MPEGALVWQCGRPYARQMQRDDTFAGRHSGKLGHHPHTGRGGVPPPIQNPASPLRTHRSARRMYRAPAG